MLALDKVRFVGEAVALVLADDPHVAEQAVQLITADYEELPAVYDEVEALTSSVIVHDELKPAGTFADLKHLSGRKNTNVTLDYQLRRGDVDAAFASAGRVFEHTFRTQPVTHTTLEPFICLAELNEDTLTLHTTTQMPSFVRIEIARLLGWTENRVRVKVLHLGGGFAAKTYIRIEALAAVAALLARRPVRLLLTMEEQFYTVVAHASTFKIKSAVDRDGRVTARQCQVVWNGGAYADIGPRVAQKSGFTAAGPYEIDNVKINSTEVYTNWPVAASRRGFGIPKLCWAYESHTDMIARELGIDPLQFRQKNILRQGRPQSTGTIMQEDTIADVLNELAPADELGRPVRSRQGPGQTRPRHRHRLQGCHRADHIRRHADHQCRRKLQPADQHDGHGAGVRHRDGADRRRGSRHHHRPHQGDQARHRHHAVRHGDLGLALDLPHGHMR